MCAYVYCDSCCVDSGSRCCCCCCRCSGCALDNKARFPIVTGPDAYTDDNDNDDDDGDRRVVLPNTAVDVVSVNDWDRSESKTALFIFCTVKLLLFFLVSCV